MSMGNYLKFGFLFMILFCLPPIKSSAHLDTTRKPEFANNTFPDHFLIGVGTSAYQIEGAWDTDAKGHSIWDNLVHTRPELIHNRENGDVACDSYRFYKTDIALIKSLGVYRFSISWSRILPKGDTNFLNFAGIDYYRVLIDEILANGIEPMVTLYHWDLPQRLQNLGGWLNPLIIDYMEDYASLVFELYGEKVKLWITINEPFQIVSGYADLVNASKAPALYLDSPANYIVAYNLLRSHARVYRLYEQKFRPSQNGRVGITLDTSYYKSKTSSAADVRATARAWAFNFQIFSDPIFGDKGDFPEIIKKIVADNSNAEGRRRSRLPSFTKAESEALRGSADFLGLNHYTSFLCADAPGLNTSLVDKDRAVIFEADPRWPKNDAGWPVFPEGILETLRFIKDNYNNPPVFITENGYGSKPGILNDESRINYHRDYLSEILIAKDTHGCNVLGYIVWSLLDNFEWNYGYSLRFGIIEVDFTRAERTRKLKSSAKFFKTLLESRVLPPKK